MKNEQDHYIFTSDARANRNVDILRDMAKQYGIKHFYDITDRSDFKANPDYKGEKERERKKMIIFFTFSGFFDEENNSLLDSCSPSRILLQNTQKNIKQASATSRWHRRATASPGRCCSGRTR